MDEAAEQLLARIDERVGTILKGMDQQRSAFDKHIEQDREDFKEVHSRISEANNKINAVGRKQAWMLGAGAGLGATMGLIGAWLRSAMTGGGA